MAQRSYKYRIYPNRTQQKQLAQFFGAKRWVWNACLAWRSNLYSELDESVSGVDFSRELTFLKQLECFDWLRLTPATVYIQALRDQDAAFRRFFKEGAGYPRFKSRHGHQAIRFQLDQRIVMNNYRAGELLKLPGLGAIKVRWTRKPVGIPKMATVSKDTAGRYFVSMSIKEETATKPIIGKTCGIDLGVKDAVVVSDGTKYLNPRHLLQYAEQMRRLQQRLARQQKTSNRRATTKLRIAKLHTRIADARQNHLHQLTTRLINENQVICVEDLNVAGMTRSAAGALDNPGRNVRQKAGLNRSILDVSFGELVRQLEYKAQWYGRTLVKIDRWFPSSKTCSCCGHKLDELRLDVREWTCPKCRTVHDRDINAAINIETEGLKLLTPGGPGEVRDAGGERACPVSVSPRSTVQPSTCQEQV